MGADRRRSVDLTPHPPPFEVHRGARPKPGDRPHDPAATREGVTDSRTGKKCPPFPFGERRPTYGCDLCARLPTSRHVPKMPSRERPGPALVGAESRGRLPGSCRFPVYARCPTASPSRNTPYGPSRAATFRLPTVAARVTPTVPTAARSTVPSRRGRHGSRQSRPVCHEMRRGNASSSPVRTCRDNLNCLGPRPRCPALARACGGRLRPDAEETGLGRPERRARRVGVPLRREETVDEASPPPRLAPYA